MAKYDEEFKLTFINTYLAIKAIIGLSLPIFYQLDV